MIRLIRRCFGSIPKVGGPIVALESAVISHGLPHPQNIETALIMEEIVRAGGAEPATIGVVMGKLRIGMTPDEIKQLAMAPGRVKLGARDLPSVIGDPGAYGGTTVSGTMAAAESHKIKVFATGGIGGVHRGFGRHLDISADLIQLSKTPMIVVCAGVKSILDVGATLEYLEMLGVPVITLLPPGKNAFPGFYTTDSGFPSQIVAHSIEEVCKIYKNARSLGLKTGILCAVPPPENKPELSLKIKEWITQAVSEAVENGIVGKPYTPFVLQRLNELSEGQTVGLNVALLKNNARIAAKIAVKLNGSESSAVFSSSESQKVVEKGPLIGVVGLSAVDILSKSPLPLTEMELNGSTYHGEVFIAAGGVGRNIADMGTQLGSNIRLLSAVGCDVWGNLLKEKLCSHMDLTHVKVTQDLTPRF